MARRVGKAESPDTIARGSGNAWMERLYALVAALPRVGASELPDLMAPALASV